MCGYVYVYMYRDIYIYTHICMYGMIFTYIHIRDGVPVTDTKHYKHIIYIYTHIQYNTIQ